MADFNSAPSFFNTQKKNAESSIDLWLIEAEQNPQKRVKKAIKSAFEKQNLHKLKTLYQQNETFAQALNLQIDQLVNISNIREQVQQAYDYGKQLENTVLNQYIVPSP